jgi:transcriptional regulator with XRE-family HTH domain
MNGERIKMARRRSNLSLRDLAHKMNNAVTAQAIGKYERNEMTPSSEVLISLTQALDVSLAYLMAPHAKAAELLR